MENSVDSSLQKKAPLFGKEWWIALLMTVFVVAGFYFMYGIRYEVNDDAIISNIAAGAYGAETHWLVYVNVLLGWFLKPFYWLMPGLNWFVVLQLAGGIACFAALGRCLLLRAGPLRGGAIYLVFILLGGFEFFTKFHYVKYASLFLVTGIVFLARNLGKINGAAIAGMLLAVLGSMLRFQQFFAVGGLSAILLIWLFIKLDKPAKIRAAASVAAMCALAFLFFGADSLAYRLNPGWNAYREYNQTRTEISDFRIYFAQEPADITGLNYTATEFEMLQSWNYYDTDVFPLEKLEDTLNALPQNTLRSAVRATAEAGFKMLYYAPVHILFSATVLAWLFLSSKKNWPAMLGTLAMLAAMVFLLCWRGRYLSRVDYTLVFAAIVFISFFIRPPQALQTKGVLFAASLLIIGLIPSFIAMQANAQDYWLSRLPRAQQIEEMDNEQNLYLLDVNLVDAANGYDVWHTRPAGFFSNKVFTGSWLMNSPFQNDALANYQIENLYADSVNNSTVYFADFYHRELTEEYLQEHYSPDAQLLLVSEHGDYNLYAAVATR